MWIFFYIYIYIRDENHHLIKNKNNTKIHWFKNQVYTKKRKKKRWREKNKNTILFLNADLELELECRSTLMWVLFFCFPILIQILKILKR